MRPSHVDISFVPALRSTDPLVYEDTGKFSAVELVVVLILIADHVFDCIINQTACARKIQTLYIGGTEPLCLIWIGRVDEYEVVCHLWGKHG